VAGRSLDVNATSEWELIDRCRRGNTSAFEPLVRQHEAHALAIAEGLLGDPDDAADAVQEAFVKAFRALGRMRDGSAFGPWFRTILRNHCRDRLRASASRGTVPWEEGAVDAAAWTPSSGSTAVERAELAEAVRAALSRLSPEHREILVLKEMEGLGYAEIAEELGVPPGTVASRLHHARGLLRKIVAAEGIALEGGER
jgi:RNA polymerase sigma factor (sigma-70 family)